MSLKFSLVTPSYQHVKYIRQTIDSVLEQDYANIDFHVIDGNSTDGTVDILRSYGDRLHWISEPDRGQADAINKGFRQTTGEIMGWLNSDDYYAPGVLKKVAELFTTHPEIQLIYGDAMGISESGHMIGLRTHIRERMDMTQSDQEILINQYCFVVQPATFWRRSLWQDIGELNADLQYSMDYEYWMRVAQRYSFHYLPEVLAFERLYTNTKTSRGNIPRMEEIERIALLNGGHGLPRKYVSEAAVYYTFRAVRRPFTKSALADFQRVVQLKPNLRRYLSQLAVGLFMGQQAVPMSGFIVKRWLGRR